jgi:PAS domain-containing protein
MACSGGCLGGPAISTERSEILAASDLLAHARRRGAAPPSEFFARIELRRQPSSQKEGGHPLDKLQAALASLGKYSPEDELNCSGCGYPGCRELAAAILDGAAEPEMCVSNMRRLATRKAAALVKAMPAAMVMVDRDMNILEANESFIKMFGKTRPGEPQTRLEAVAGTPVEDWLEFGGLIRRVLKTGVDLNIEHKLYKGQLYNLSVFSVEKYMVAGAVVTDVTSLRDGRASLSRKVREVLDRNMGTVQTIACLLGEHMVETESVLTAIAEDLEDADEPLQEGSGSWEAKRG